MKVTVFGIKVPLTSQLQTRKTILCQIKLRSKIKAQKMATARHTIAPESPAVENQAQGAEYGFSKSQIQTTDGGRTEIQVPASVADRFEAAKQGAHERTAGTGPTPIDDKHKSGFEQLPDRARNMTAVTKAQVQSGGEADTRSPEIGFPAREYVE
jgi:hypothetical protein